MKILVTNDDGVHAPGLLALKQSLSSLGQVVAVAPERPRSASSHAITLHKPLRLTRVLLKDGSEAYAGNGTPADCVALGTSADVLGRPDLVVSGINLGPNLGVDIIYSGTVAAAMEAAICGLPAFAVSVASNQADDFAPAARFARALAEKILSQGLPEGCFLNVNVPAVSEEEIAGVTLTRQGPLRYDNRIERRTDPRGGVYYWLTGERVNDGDGPGSDVHAVRNNFISVTPVRLDLTDERAREALDGWSFDWPPG